MKLYNFYCLLGFMAFLTEHFIWTIIMFSLAFISLFGFEDKKA